MVVISQMKNVVYDSNCSAIALFVLHECGEKRKEVKRFRSISSDRIDSKPIGSFEDEPRSPFVFFLYCNHNLPLFLDMFALKTHHLERILGKATVGTWWMLVEYVSLCGRTCQERIDMSRNVSPSSSASSPASMSFLSNMEL
ncbi:unnamed protein product [Eruca vesicaria subsp. sativa]|uniref:Uncharacterized protein n=1 Tax=Eruca vesicaria subsp. sativa TaxID=29727 RepID=A0ABC8JHS7_ERUVS|nr:unnamed protein product [Eruca vesicaria subsp. sativa]